MIGIVILLLLIFAAILYSQRSSEGFQPTIFLSIGSYRDSECLKTVSDAFEKAANPGSLYVGICQQNKEADESCIVGLKVDMSHVRSMDLAHTAAKGPTYARYLCATMYMGEDYFMQVDSHTRFVQDWDATLIDMIKQCTSNKPILTHYPHSYTASKSELADQVPVMCRSKWNADGIPTFEAVMKPLSAAALRPVPFCAGGFIFAPGRLLAEVPMDPGLDFIFVGEEILLSARFYTHGWDLFTPSANVVLHHYERHEGPRFWQDLTNYRKIQVQSVGRVRQLLGLEEPNISLTDAYGMGRERSLHEFWEFSKLDPANKTSKSQESFCA